MKYETICVYVDSWSLIDLFTVYKPPSCRVTTGAVCQQNINYKINNGCFPEE